MSKGWFEVDRDGLAKIIERRGKSFALAELLQNAWDAPGVTRVELKIEPCPGRPLAFINITDDSPVGFANLDHAFTLFADSIKKTDTGLRGRFNFGEKLVLSLCTEARIASTTGSVEFHHETGRKVYPRRKRAKGTHFFALIRMTREEIDAAIAAVHTFIPPAGILTFVNGEPLAGREPLRQFEVTLPTEIAGEDGVLRRARRTTWVSVYQRADGQPGRLCEMGIPVVALDDAFDVDIGQKVPLSMERDNVSPAYLREVRVSVLNHAADLVSEETVSQPWVDDALTSPDISADAVRTVIRERYGAKVVAYDMSDPEANNRAVAQGYAIIHGGAFDKAQWANIRAAGAARPAGHVTPTPKPFGDGPMAERVEMTPALVAFERFCETMARELMGRQIQVDFFKKFNAVAAYGPGHLSFNVGSLGRKWFEGPIREEHIDLLIHEFGHEYESNHLSSRYNDALTKLAGKAVMLALAKPHLFRIETYFAGRVAA